MTMMTKTRPGTLHLFCNARLDPAWLWTWEDGVAERPYRGRIFTLHIPITLSIPVPFLSSFWAQRADLVLQYGEQPRLNAVPEFACLRAYTHRQAERGASLRVVHAPCLLLFCVDTPPVGMFAAL